MQLLHGEICEYFPSHRSIPHYPSPLKQRYPCKHPRRNTVTVCAAAICEGGVVISISDRMITTGDIEFEPPQRKVWNLTSSVSVLAAGDSTLQAEILQDVDATVKQRVFTEPANWWRVRDVAELYRGAYQDIKNRRAESAILAPLGLDHDSFVANQADMEPSLVKSLVDELTQFSLTEVECIFVGTDTDGPVDPKTGSPGIYTHIYVSHGGQVSCYDPIGFAAIGIGAWHAQSQLMFARHTRLRPIWETLFSLYSAKKHAEVAPGVGKDTDMFSIGKNLGSRIDFGDHVINELERIYQESRTGTQAVIAHAESETKSFLEMIAKQAEEAGKGTAVSPLSSADSPNPQLTKADPPPPPPLQASPGGSGES